MLILEFLWDLSCLFFWLGYLFFFLGYLITPFWDVGVVIWFSSFAASGKENEPYAHWYDDEVRPLMYEDPRMLGLSPLTKARLRRRAIKVARFGPGEHYGE